jgi:hypothetical protein
MLKKVICSLFVVWLLGNCAQESEPPSSRASFVKTINKVHEGMSETAVLSLLGRPDEMVANAPSGADVTLRYGVAGNPAIATFGQVQIDQNHKVAYVVGKGAPLPAGLFSEDEIRSLLDVLNHVRFDVGISGWDPRPLICAVNALQALGKEKALAAVDEFLRVRGGLGGEGIFYVLRVLFDVPATPGYMPGIYYGKPDSRGPADPKLLPLFPIALEGDIPFLLAGPVDWEGPGFPTPKTHVAYFRKCGKLRSRPLVPTVRPFTALNEVMRSARFVERDGFTSDREALFGKALEGQVWRFLAKSPDNDGAAHIAFAVGAICVIAVVMGFTLWYRQVRRLSVPKIPSAE